jgi:hypothetical protein
MEPTSWVVSRHLSLELIDASGEASRLDGELGYDPRDPFAVVAVISASPTPIRWVFGRDLLIEGLFSPAGDGDVHVWPSVDHHGEAVVLVELSTPSGSALLQAPSRDVSEFLHHTFAVVPRGAEDLNLDLDYTLLQLLGTDARGLE